VFVGKVVDIGSTLGTSESTETSGVDLHEKNEKAKTNKATHKIVRLIIITHHPL
jgi:hypothetical protein